MRITGSCHCGDVCYEADVDPSAVGICHCTDCQQLTGSAYRVTISTSPSKFHVLSGSPRAYRKLGDSGRPSDQFFCGTCGAPLWRVAAETGEVGIRLGTVDQRMQLNPTHQSFVASALPFAFTISKIPKD